MDIQLENTWKIALESEFSKPYFTDLVRFVKNEYQQNKVFPKGSLIFNAFNLCPFNEVKVVLLGQDPYHGENQAHGLCFSVQDGIALPPSLKNIFNELKSDLDIEPRKSGNLSNWAKQGVLMLNATLTVRKGEPGSHQNKGWAQFTDSVIKKISNEKEHIVFILWGAYAQKKEQLIDSKKHFILKSAHPSPFSVYRGFYGCKHFSKTNNYLKMNDIEIINW